jgi:hypothetical protein
LRILLDSTGRDSRWVGRDNRGVGSRNRNRGSCSSRYDGGGGDDGSPSCLLARWCGGSCPAADGADAAGCITLLESVSVRAASVAVDAVLVLVTVPYRC